MPAPATTPAAQPDLGWHAYQGHRATHEPNDGGPFCLLSNDEWDAADQAAWRNSATWVLYAALGGVNPSRIKELLTGYADFLENQEVDGRLEVGLPIAGTAHTAYSQVVREVADTIPGG